MASEPWIPLSKDAGWEPVKVALPVNVWLLNTAAGARITGLWLKNEMFVVLEQN